MTLAELARPYLWLAAIAFFVGFVSYVVLGQPAAADEPRPWSVPQQVTAPVSDDWNLTKHI